MGGRRGVVHTQVGLEVRKPAAWACIHFGAQLWCVHRSWCRGVAHTQVRPRAMSLWRVLACVAF